MLDLKGLKILVADGDRSSVEWAGNLLKKMNGEIYYAAGGLEAFSQLWRHRPQCLLIEDNVPVVCGLEFYKELRRMPEFKDLAVIVSSAQFDKTKIANYLAFGMPSFLVKPFGENELCRCLSTIVENSNTESESTISVSAVDQYPPDSGQPVAAG